MVCTHPRFGADSPEPVGIRTIYETLRNRLLHQEDCGRFGLQKDSQAVMAHNVQLGHCGPEIVPGVSLGGCRGTVNTQSAPGDGRTPPPGGLGRNSINAFS